jgi:S1-C subfamily serine protease
MYRKNLIISSLAVLALVPVTGRAQQREERERRAEQEDKARRDATRFAYAFGFEDRDRPRLGISTESSGMRDTLGLLVSDVTEDGPASKAGIHEGDRIQAVNGVNLRLAREDAGEDDMEGIATRRLIRTLGKLKIGDEVDLRVWSDGSVKNVKVKTVSIEDLEGRRFSQASFGDSDRASLGIGLGSSGSRRDTLGILVSSVIDDGPAAKAGLIEGDRIQSINGVDLRVPGEDAGDWAMSSSRVRRLTREMEKAKPGDEVELRVYSGGSVKTVRIKTVSASDIPHSNSFFFGDMPGGVMAFPRGQLIRPRVMTPMTPGMLRYRVSPLEEGLLKQRLDEAIPKIAPLLQRKLRSAVTI